MPTMKAMQVPRAGTFEAVERPIPEPGRDEIRIRIAACGVCHSDVFTRDALWPGLELPRIPGHELAGTIDAVGDGVRSWKTGDRVGVGWAGIRDNSCEACRRGEFVNCANHRVTGIGYDGGYAEYMIAPSYAVAAIPAEIPFAEAGPLLCAGVTTYNALRHTGARPGDLVAVQGIGGLGHLGVQFARQMGFRTVAISSGSDKRPLAEKLGAHEYVDTRAGDPAAALRKLGGARVILATAPSGKAIAPLIDGLGLDGELMVVGAGFDPIPVAPTQLIQGTRSVRGWSSGSAIDSEDTMRFAALTGVRPMIERFPLARAPEAFDKMMSNAVRFRAVLET